MIKLLIGGSPCTFWSVAQNKNKRETKAEGLGWELFLNYVIAKEKFQPDYFLYENNWSASKEIKEQIQEELNCKLMRINSNLVSAQNRDRFYVFNWDVEQPEDRGILLKDIVQKVDEKTEYCYTLKSKNIKGKNALNKFRLSKKTLFEKSNCLTTCCLSATNASNTTVLYDDGQIYKLTPIECERLQTLPDNYTKGICNTQRAKAIGNGWTAEVIIHILNGVLKDVPKDEKIIVLSMYDGIGTGRYCLDKMGFTNIEYHAYEIDKYAIQVAMHNYPDIIQHGDAFQVRNENWTIGGNKNE